MPINIDTTISQNFNIPEDVASIRIQLFGAGGGGEFVNQTTSIGIAGGNGSSTSLMGVSAGGGQGGGVGGKASGGAGGTVSDNFNWGLRNVTITSSTGGSGGLNAGGVGASAPPIFGRNGGNGTPPQAVFYSSVYHIFNNDTDQHIFGDSSADINVSFQNQYAPNGLPCFPSYGSKYYSIRFVVPYDDSSYSVSINNISSLTAAGGGGFNSLAGILNKSRFGFDVWFCRNYSFNTYVRSFSIQTSGNRSSLAGRGGGGGSYALVNFTRQNLIDSYTYRPGTSHSLVIGTAGSAGGNTATSGTSGRAVIYMLREPRITVSLDDSPIFRGESTKLRWTVTGDADSITIKQGDNAISQSSNLNTFITVTPTFTATYTLIASGLGGTKTEQIELIVYQPPSISLSSPLKIYYGNNLNIAYDVENAINLTATVRYTYLDGTYTEDSFDVSTTGDVFAVENIPWNDIGPSSIRVSMIAYGQGNLTDSDSDDIPVVIDITPSFIDIPQSEDKIRDEEPVITPDVEITTEQILIDDIDIPVEIKSEYPIQVEIDNDGNWRNIREM